MVRLSSAKAPSPVRFWASPPIVLLIGVFIAIAVVGPLVGVHLLDSASSAQVRFFNDRADLDGLLRVQLGEETALRGYLATRDRYFLAPDGPPDPLFDEQARTLEARLRASGPAGAAHSIAMMRQVHDRWEQRVALPLLHDPSASDAVAVETYGKLLTDQMRLQAQVLRGELTRAADKVQAELRREINGMFAAGAAAITIFALAALWYAVGRARVAVRLDEDRALIAALQQTLRVDGARLPRTRMGTVYASAIREMLVGGDLLDAWRSGLDSGWLLIADASGKGIAAARQAAFTQAALRALAMECGDPAAILERFGRLYVQTFDDPSTFMVVFLAAFDARSQTLRYASAGHATAYVRRRGGVVERLPPTGSLVGIDAGERYSTATVPLDVGDMVLLATDGLSEARDANGELFGEERVVALFERGPSDPQMLCETLLGAANAYSGGVQDDLAVVALRVIADAEDTGAPFMGLGATGVLDAR